MIEDKSIAMKVRLMGGEHVLQTRPVLMDVEMDGAVINATPVTKVTFGPFDGLRHATAIHLVDQEGRVVYSQNVTASPGDTVTWGCK